MLLIVDRKDFYYSFNTKGYMIYYLDYPIGGAGINKYCSGSNANLKLFKEEAEKDIHDIMNGCGRKKYIDEIKKIQQRNKGEIKWENII